MGKDDDLFPFPIGIILLFIFFIALATGMSIEAIIGIIGIVVVILLAGWSGFYKVFLKKKLEDLGKIRKNHLKKIGGILEELSNIELVLDIFAISIPKLDDFKDGKLYLFTKQHLKAYPLIFQDFNESLELVKDLNNQMRDMKGFVLEKIDNTLGKNYEHTISQRIGLIIKDGIPENIAWLDRRKWELRGDGLYIDLSDDWKISTSVHSKDFDMEKISQFLTKLLQYKVFREKYTRIQETYTGLQDNISRFKDNLKERIRQINKGIELKGKCDDCPSFWKL